MRRWFWLVLIALLVLHQDYWQWDNTTLLLGFLPQTLAYHAALSIAAALFWWWAVRNCWPRELDQMESAESRKEAAL